MPGATSRSSNLAGLAAGEIYSSANFESSGSSLVIKFCELVSEPELDYAFVTVYLDDGTQYSLCPGDLPPTAAPSAAPTATTTSAPTTITVSPPTVSPPTVSPPTAAPTAAPTATPTVDCTCDVTLTVKILTDNYPDETTWTLKDLADDCDVVDSAGGPYSLSANTYFTEVPGLCRFSDYVFVIYDSYGDGLCCAYGVGEYELLLDGGFSIYKNGGAFENEATHIFTAIPPSSATPTAYAEGPFPVALGGVSDFAIFGKTGITTTSGTVIEGNIGKRSLQILSDFLFLGTALAAASMTGSFLEFPIST
jgi:hypothetical protein